MKYILILSFLFVFGSAFAADESKDKKQDSAFDPAPLKKQIEQMKENLNTERSPDAPDIDTGSMLKQIDRHLDTLSGQSGMSKSDAQKIAERIYEQMNDPSKQDAGEMNKLLEQMANDPEGLRVPQPPLNNKK
jgi:methyl-accepting chemotaxis protein